MGSLACPRTTPLMAARWVRRLLSLRHGEALGLLCPPSSGSLGLTPSRRQKTLREAANPTVRRTCLATRALEDTSNTRACQVRCRVRCQARCQARCQVLCQARCPVRCQALTWTDTGCRPRVWRLGGCLDQAESHQVSLAPATLQVWEDLRDLLDHLELLELKDRGCRDLTRWRCSSSSSSQV